MRRSLRIGGSSSVQWRKVGRSWRLRMCFRRLLCVRIEIDQLQCVNCWVIIHCLSVSCTTINHSRCALVIWSSLQLTSKQWIITQQFTAGADLFLKYWKQKFITSVTKEQGLNNHQYLRFRHQRLETLARKTCKLYSFFLKYHFLHQVNVLAHLLCHVTYVTAFNKWFNLVV